MDQLKEIVEEFLQQLPEVQEPAENQTEEKGEIEQEEDQFDDFQSADNKQQKEVKNQYADFNWDFLNIKKNNHEPVPLINPSSSIDSPLKVIDTDPPENRKKKYEKMTFTLTPKK